MTFCKPNKPSCEQQWYNSRIRYLCGRATKVCFKFSVLSRAAIGYGPLPKSSWTFWSQFGQGDVTCIGSTFCWQHIVVWGNLRRRLAACSTVWWFVRSKVGLKLNASKTEVLTTQTQPLSILTTPVGLELEVLEGTKAHKWVGCLLSTLNLGNRLWLWTCTPVGSPIWAQVRQVKPTLRCNKNNVNVNVNPVCPIGQPVSGTGGKLWNYILYTSTLAKLQKFRQVWTPKFDINCRDLPWR